MKDCKGENCDKAPDNQHSRECLFEHFLAYTGYNKYTDEILEALQKAYFDGINAGKPDISEEEIAQIIAKHIYGDELDALNDGKITVCENTANAISMKIDILPLYGDGKTWHEVKEGDSDAEGA